MAAGREAPLGRVREIVAKGRLAAGLRLEEAACLLEIDDPADEALLFEAAREVKERIYGKRMVLFAPLYISNHCANDCAYCGYRHGNREMRRRRLSPDEVAGEVRALEAMGHKRLVLETGEDPVNCPLDYVLGAIETIYSTRHGGGNIRRVNVNIAAATEEDYRRLKTAGIGTYILFQETYHRPTYERLHRGPKADYCWHLEAMDRAMTAGIDDVGIGVLFGLYDYRFEVLALLHHALHLEQRFGVGPHTISVPRLRPAPGTDVSCLGRPLSDGEFKRVVAVLRLAVPYTGLILSTRESPALRDELLGLGISQLSAGSRTGVGGYREGDSASVQFAVEDNRAADEIVRSLVLSGYLPSYCTACYRKGRTGDRFMKLAKQGLIGNVCQPNAILTLEEYLLDYASPATLDAGRRAIANHLEQIGSPEVKAETNRRLERIRAGERDLYF
ncbi:MAG: [FeFe] hydrogenase H-cluster radical SAM maturase HydG [bacterium]|nr:[FeFe] hydrogenase H-cluster radical SAM maturase HydG [bacterium]